MLTSVFGNGTDIVHWRASPTTRGTFEILTICLTTLLLCVWTAVHLNVPPPGSAWEQKFRKFGWLILTLIAPEMVAYTAWYQRSEAKKIMRGVNEARGLPEPPSWFQSSLRNSGKALTRLKAFVLPRQRRISKQPTLEAQKPEGQRPWTMVHGFYATMGGFAFEYPGKLPEAQRFLPTDDREICFLHGDAVLRLTKLYGHTDSPFNLSEEDIRSKSKANGLAKTLVCIQALWFIAQCVTRLISHAPISLLELNTFGHAISALLIYFLWWEKPFEVDYPSLVHNEKIRDLFASYCMSKRSLTAGPVEKILYTYLQNHLSIPAKKKMEYKSIAIYEKSVLAVTDRSQTITPSSRNVEHMENTLEDHNNVQDGIIELQPGQILPGTGWKVRSLSQVNFRKTAGSYSFSRSDGVGKSMWERFRKNSDDKSFFNSPTYSLCLGYRDVNRWKMARRVEDGLWTLSMFSKSFRPRIRDWPEVDDLLVEFGIALGFCTAALIYGGLHALAWSAYFESSTERILWRISSCVVMGGQPVLYLLIKTDDALVATRLDRGPWQYIAAFPFMLILVAYVLARAYLVVGCFIQLFHLPAGAFDVPQWTAYFPHIA